MKILKSLRENKHLTILFAANVLSQAIPVIFSPFLTRLYSPSDFGVYALFYSIMNVFTVIFSMRFENVLFINENYSKAKQSIYTFILITISIFGLFFISFNLVSAFASFENEDVIRISLVASFLNVLCIYLLTYSNRLGLYSLMGQFKVSKVLILVVFQLLLGFYLIKLNGLVISSLISMVLILVYYFRKLGLNPAEVIKNPVFKNVKGTFKRYKKFPIYSMPTSLIDALNASLPIFLLGYLYSENIVGYYSLSFKVAYVPIILISISLSESLKKKTSDYIREGRSYRRELIKWGKVLLPISIVIFLGFYFLSEPLFPVIFGKEWIYSGFFTKMLAIMFFFRVLVNPFGFIFLVSEKQKIVFIIQLSTLIIATLALYFGFLFFNDPLMSVFLYSIAYSMKYIAEAISIFVISP